MQVPEHFAAAISLLSSRRYFLSSLSSFRQRMHLYLSFRDYTPEIYRLQYWHFFDMTACYRFTERDVFLHAQFHFFF